MGAHQRRTILIIEPTMHVAPGASPGSNGTSTTRAARLEGRCDNGTVRARGDRRHEHGHGHGGGHSALWLGSPTGRVHRVGRRQFLSDLGRNTFAIAVLGGVAVACSGDDDPVDDVVDVVDGAVGPDGPSVAVAGGTSAPAPQPDPKTLRWAQAALGSVSAYVLVRGNDAAVVDTGNAGSVDQIGAALATLNATFDDVRHVVLTHSHPDHIGSLPAVLDRAVGAAAYAGAEDIGNIAASVQIEAVGDGDDVFGLQVIGTPGHTPGSISVFDPGIGLLLAGDALNGNDDGTGLLGPNERFTRDMDTANRSVSKLAGYEVEAVAMGHGRPVTSGAGHLLADLAAGI